MGTILFKQTGQQYNIDAGMIENIAREFTVTRKASNGSQAQFWIESEYPAIVVVNAHSEGYNILNGAYIRDRKGRR